MLLFFVFHPEDVSDEPDECDVKYKKVGCYKDKIKARALSVKVFSDRKNIECQIGKWEKFLKRQVMLEEYNSSYLAIAIVGNRP